MAPQRPKRKPSANPSLSASSSGDEPEMEPPRSPVSSTHKDYSSEEIGDDRQDTGDHEEIEESSSSSEDEDSETGGKQSQPTSKRSVPKLEPVLCSGSGFESDPQHLHPAPILSINEIKSKKLPTFPSSQASKSKKASASASAALPSKPAESSKSKRKSSKRNLIERFWNEGDSLKIVQGIIDFHTKHGIDLESKLNMDLFHEHMRPLLELDFSKSQLSDKIRKIRRKYESSALNRDGPKFRKSEEKTVYELSKKIWGPKGAVTNDGNAHENASDHGNQLSSERSRKRRNIDRFDGRVRKRSGAVKEKGAVAVEEKIVHQDSYLYLREAVGSLGNEYAKEFVKNELKLIDKAKVEVLDKEFKKLAVAETKLHLQWLDVMKMTMELVNEAINSSG